MNTQNIHRIYFVFLALLALVFDNHHVIDPALAPRLMYLCIFLWLGVYLLNKTELLLCEGLFKSPIFIACSSFIAALFLSSLVNQFNPENHATIVKWLAGFLFFSITSVVLYLDKINYQTFAKGFSAFFALALLGAYLDIYNIVQSSDVLIRKITEIKSFFGNKNLLSSVLFLCIPWILVLRQCGQKFRTISTFLLLSSLPIIFLTQTRAVWLALIIFVSAVGFYYSKSYQKLKLFLFLGLSGLLIFISLILLPTYKTDSSNKFLDVFIAKLGNQNTINCRSLYWKNAFKMWSEQPILGIGPGNFGKYFPKYGLNKMSIQVADGTETLQRVHNDFLSVLTETGFIGFCSYISLWMMMIFALLRLIKQTKESQERSIYIYLLAGLLGFSVIGFFDFPMERIEHQLIFFSMMACVLVASVKKKSSAEFNPQKRITILAISLPLVYVTIVSLMRLNSELHMMKMYNAKAKANWSEVLYEAKKSKNKFYQLDLTGIPVDWYQGMAHFGLGELDQSQECFESAYKAAPFQIQVIHNLGVVYEQKKAYDQAIQYYQKALKISPSFEEALLSLSACYYKKGMYHQAFLTIEQVSTASKNIRYRTYLAKILIKEYNSILAKINQPILSGFMAREMKSVDKINNFYWMSKAQKMNLKAMFLEQTKTNDYYWYSLSVTSKHK